MIRILFLNLARMTRLPRRSRWMVFKRLELGKNFTNFSLITSNQGFLANAIVLPIQLFVIGPFSCSQN